MSVAREILNITEIAVNKTMNDIKQTMSSKGIDNTRETSNSMKVVTGSNYVELKGSAVLEVLNTGRGPGRFPPVSEMQAWVRSKPVDISAFVVGRKIAREGTEIFKDNSKGIQLENKIINLRSELMRIIPKETQTIISNQLRDFTRKRLQTIN